MVDVSHICRNCAFANWQHTLTGRVQRKLAGRCMYKFPDVPLMPIASGWFINQHWPPRLQGIWWDGTLECQTWEPLKA